MQKGGTAQRRREAEFESNNIMMSQFRTAARKYEPDSDEEDFEE